MTKFYTAIKPEAELLPMAVNIQPNNDEIRFNEIQEKVKNLTQEQKNIFLLYYIQNSNIYGVKFMLAAGAKRDAIDENGNTTLHHAIDFEREEWSETHNTILNIIFHGTFELNNVTYQRDDNQDIYPDQPNNDYKTGFWTAVAHKNLDVIKFFWDFDFEICELGKPYLSAERESTDQFFTGANCINKPFFKAIELEAFEIVKYFLKKDNQNDVILEPYQMAVLPSGKKEKQFAIHYVLQNKNCSKEMRNILYKAYIKAHWATEFPLSTDKAEKEKFSAFKSLELLFFMNHLYSQDSDTYGYLVDMKKNLLKDFREKYWALEVPNKKDLFLTRFNELIEDYTFSSTQKNNIAECHGHFSTFLDDVFYQSKLPNNDSQIPNNNNNNFSGDPQRVLSNSAPGVNIAAMYGRSGASNNISGCSRNAPNHNQDREEPDNDKSTENRKRV